MSIRSRRKRLLGNIERGDFPRIRTGLLSFIGIGLVGDGWGWLGNGMALAWSGLRGCFLHGRALELFYAWLSRHTVHTCMRDTLLLSLCYRTVHQYYSLGMGDAIWPDTTVYDAVSGWDVFVPML